MKKRKIGGGLVMRLVLGIVLVICVVTQYALCRAAGEADRKMEEFLSRQFTSGGGKYNADGSIQGGNRK